MSGRRSIASLDNERADLIRQIDQLKRSNGITWETEADAAPEVRAVLRTLRDRLEENERPTQ